MSDAVNHPQHYNETKFEVWDVLDAWFPTVPLLWQVGKYIARADRKGAPIEDLKKAKAYLEREIEKREGRKSESGQLCPTCVKVLYFAGPESLTGNCPCCHNWFARQ